MRMHPRSAMSQTTRAWIENQEAHPRRKSFREEPIELLEKAGIEYDPRYLG